MNILKGNCIVAQSGGPTAVINSSAYGVIKEFSENNLGTAYIGFYGIEGILQKKLLDVKLLETDALEGLKNLPSSALGSCRYKLKDFLESDEEYKKLFEIFTEYDVRYFYYIGGNDSMDAASKLSSYAKKIGYEIRIIGVPKTIDNDLVITDHCPGFGSSAKYIANTAMELWLDTNVYKSNSIMVLEVMGRDTGWLAASSGIIKKYMKDINQLIYIPEIPFTIEKFLADVSNALKTNNKLLIVTSEGLKDSDGNYISVDDNIYEKDQFGHKQLGGVGKYLQNAIKTNIEKRVKFIELGITQRCAMHCVSKQDFEEAETVGRSAVKYSIQGNSGFMVALKRIEGECYSYKTELVPLSEVCNKVKTVPVNWMNSEGTHISEEMQAYVEPLILGEVNTYGAAGLLSYYEIKKDFEKYSK